MGLVLEADMDRKLERVEFLPLQFNQQPEASSARIFRCRHSPMILKCGSVLTTVFGVFDITGHEIDEDKLFFIQFKGNFFFIPLGAIQDTTRKKKKKKELLHAMVSPSEAHHQHRDNTNLSVRLHVRYTSVKILFCGSVFNRGLVCLGVDGIVTC